MLLVLLIAFGWYALAFGQPGAQNAGNSGQEAQAAAQRAEEAARAAVTAKEETQKQRGMRRSGDSTQFRPT